MSKHDAVIRIRGAQQNNLQNLDIDLPLGELVVVTGVSGSGKSSLAFDTVYAEGQRRYVETFSAYARQFLDRMDKPAVERIDGIPPAIAIDQVNPVRTSRSTVGTMTELNDHLKLLFARASTLYCDGCGAKVQRDSSQSIAQSLLAAHEQDTVRVAICFRVTVPENVSDDEMVALLARQGYTRILGKDGARLEVVQDRVRLGQARRVRLIEALDGALRAGQGRVAVRLLDADATPGPAQVFSSTLHCAACDHDFQDPVASLFSFNSPLGACATCRGFGRTMGIDYELVIPDASLSLAQGAIRPWQTPAYAKCQRDLLRHAKHCKVPVDTAWRDLCGHQQRWVLDGDGTEDDGKWYGARGFFTWLETKAYRMHIRVLLSKYRSYEECGDCAGSRLKPQALLWRLGCEASGTSEAAVSATALPGLNMPGLARMSLSGVHAFFAALKLPAPFDEATQMLVGEIRTRLRYLTEVGLGYLSLDRQSRTLSGGEVQRINLTTALGTSLTNALFVLDEPSIGLHARDMQRIIAVLQRLRDAGNSLLVVEHDEQLIRAADHVLDMGPGPGEAGGQVVAFGTPAQIARSHKSLTGRYLRGAERVNRADRKPRSGRDCAVLKVCGARANNLKDIDVSIPLGRMVCVTGVSGSGKSTLVEDVLHRALLKSFGRPSEAPGAHRSIDGAHHIADVVLVDQSAIGKSARSNPASYVGAMDAIRKLFAGEPLARERGYGPGHFSFNSGNGRCALCGGSGFEHVEMQFLSDVYLRCPDCDGARYRREILEVKLLGALCDARPRSIAEVLSLTVSEAQQFFAESPQVLRTIEPLRAVGLGYLRLGQAVPTLSGGEAQRLKLAGRLAKSGVGQGQGQGQGQGKGKGKGTLFVFDEPTTGLHLADVSILLSAFDALIDAGHSLLVIEHHLDVVAAADWIIDLGPEGGDAGGQVMDSGVPSAIVLNSAGPTGIALAKHLAGERNLSALAHADSQPRRRRRRRAGAAAPIEIHNAREHNLKNVSVALPRDKFIVVTGVSGSGKSTVAFDILFAEGQRRYLESLNAYARQFVEPASRADVDAVTAIPPTVAIEQRSSRGGRKSTVATMTELHHFLRLLYVKLGTQHCPDCDLAIEPRSADAIASQLMTRRGSTLELLAPMVIARKGYYTDLAAWAAGRGFTELRVDEERLSTGNWPRLDRYREHDIDLPVATVVIEPCAEGELRDALQRALALGKGAVRVCEGAHESLFSTVRACPGCARSFEPLDPRLFSYNSRHGWCTRCFGTGVELEGFDEEQTGEERSWNDAYEGRERSCRECHGGRLKPEALAVRYRKHSIAALSALPVSAAREWFDTLDEELKSGGPNGADTREASVARDIFEELRARLAFLERVGLGYLGLDRSAPTLSGGEAQRLRLAAQLGSNLRGVCYILDEPTIGLHTRDNRMLLDTLKALGERGNTVVVVEHDEDTIRAAEHIVDLGPGAGSNGGEVVAQGSLRAILRARRSVTGRYLAKPLLHPIDGRSTRGRASDHLIVEGASLNNLRVKSLAIPLHRLLCVSGVSGSGKSSLVREVLLRNLQAALSRSRGKPAVRGCDAVRGMQQVQRVLEVDQTPIGKTPRSCPATYIGFFDEIRRLFAQSAEARVRGYTPGRFSFNVAGGRCASCEGQGVRRVEMNFLPDVRVLCDTCGGDRYNMQTLGVRYLDRNIAQILGMSVDEAEPVFVAHPRIHRALRLLQDVGLGYLSLGQPSPTLSGGEAQRIKLVAELAKVADGPTVDPRAVKHTLYVLDEPTIGLHMADVEKLIRVLHRLVDAGNSVIVVEHNLDIVAEADWVIDLGPEGGTGGGRVVAQGPPSAIAGKRARSHTAVALGEFLRDRGAR